MYQKTGQSIKRVAEIFAYIGVIVSCIASVGAYRLVWALTGGSSYHNGNYGFSIISAIVVLVVGILLTWLSNLVLAGFGETGRQSVQHRQLCTNASFIPVR